MSDENLDVVRRIYTGWASGGAPVEIRHTAHIRTLRDARAMRLDVGWDRQDARADAGLRA